MDRQALDTAVAAIVALGEDDPLRRASRARALISDPGLSADALAQLALRERARSKFGTGADTMYFTPDGLEQASRPEVADHRARRFARAGVGSVLDLGCGIGGDALAFGRAGLRVRAVERDPRTAEIARANLGADAQVTIGTAEESPWQAAESVFLDPARRTVRGRTFDPDAYSPPLSFVLDVLARARFAAAKLGPGLDHDLVPAGVEAEWVSYERGVKEAVLWSAGFAALAPKPARRRATVLPAEVSLSDADPEEHGLAPVGRYLLEPDGAVIRAGLVRQAAADLGAHRLDERLAYLTADRPPDSALARGYRVIDVLPYSMKRLRSELRRRDVGIVEIKKRGVDIDPSQLRRDLRLAGAHSLTVILARVGDERSAILAEPATP